MQKIYVSPCTLKLKLASNYAILKTHLFCSKLCIHMHMHMQTELMRTDVAAATAYAHAESQWTQFHLLVIPSD